MIYKPIVASAESHIFKLIQTVTKGINYEENTPTLFKYTIKHIPIYTHKNKQTRITLLKSDYHFITTRALYSVTIRKPQNTC